MNVMQRCPLYIAVYGLLICLVAQSNSNAAESVPNAKSVREVAITIDDLPVVSNSPRGDAALLEITNTLVSKLIQHEIPATGFIIGRQLERQGREHINIWLDAGLQLGNHTYSHPDANSVGATSFIRDLLRGDKVIRPLLESRDQALEFFRFPMLRRGNTEELKSEISLSVSASGYRSAPVSIDNQDWVFNRAYENALVSNDSEKMEKIGFAYVDYLNSIFEFFEAKSQEILSYEPKQILLLHANAINTEYLDEVVAMLRARGYEFISLTDAMNDPVYSMSETYTGTRGLSWIHRIADTRGIPIEMEPSESLWLDDIVNSQ